MANDWQPVSRIPDPEPREHTEDFCDDACTGFVKLPIGAPADGREVEDEDNCWCACHHLLS